MSSLNDASQIQKLTGIEAVRLRPGMYVGDKDENGLHQLIYELFENSIDEIVHGFGNQIKIILHADNSVTVQDNCRGIPIEPETSTNVPIAEFIFTNLHRGQKFDSNRYKVTGGLHGVGVACVNFLSEWLHLEIEREGKIYQQNYQAGIPSSPFSVIGETNKTGTKIHFKPDATIFTVTEFNFEKLALRLRQKAYLNSGVEIALIDERKNKSQFLELCSQNGLADFVDFIAQDISRVHPKTIHFIDKIEELDLSIAAALLFTEQEKEKIYTFANQIQTPDGGTHQSGFYAGLTRTVNQFAKTNHKKPALPAKKIRAVLIAILAVTLPQPRYEGSTKAKLTSEISGIVQSFVYQNLINYFNTNPEVTNKIINHLWQEN